MKSKTQINKTFYFIEKNPPAKVLTGSCSNTEKSLHCSDSFLTLHLKVSAS